MSVHAPNLTSAPLELCKAHHSYEAQREDELSFAEGEVVRITNNADPEWWEVEKVEGGEKGWVPSNVMYTMNEALFTTLCAFDSIVVCP